MYKVRMESKQEGRKRIRRTESIDRFASVEDAQDFINAVIRQQEQVCWKAWGLMVTERTQDGSKLIVDYNPAIILFAKLTQTFEIISA